MSALVTEAFGQAPASGHLFVFFNRTRDKVRILFYDRNGYCLVSKGLDRGRFRKLEVRQDTTSARITAAELGDASNSEDSSRTAASRWTTERSSA